MPVTRMSDIDQEVVDTWNNLVKELDIEIKPKERRTNIGMEEENEILKEWVDKLAGFLFNNYYQMTYVNEEQFRMKKREIVEEICKGE